MLPASAERVPMNTADVYNTEIGRQTERDVARYGGAGATAIAQRISELDHEWDTERTLEANAATLALAGVVLAAIVDRRFLALPALVTAFLLQHALQGWCPPLPILRRLGFRTRHEIDRERTALKTLRGDFASVEEMSEADDVRAARVALLAVDR